jgi:hypothetical protein
MYTGLSILSLYLTFMEQSSAPYWYQDVKQLKINIPAKEARLASNKQFHETLTIDKKFY